MKSKTHYFVAFATTVGVALLASGCMVETDVPHDEISSPLGIKGSSRLLNQGFQIDASALDKVPAARLPKTRLKAGAFSDSVVSTQLVDTGESFELVRGLNTRNRFESTSWFLETDEAQGRLLALRRTTGGKAFPQDEAKLRDASIQRLKAWGIGGGEVLRVLQRQLLKQGETDETLEESELHRYKTFVIRGLNGVAIDGHRAIVTYAPDGSFHRAYAHWPPLAAKGHRLRTDIEVDTVISRAIEAMRAEGEKDGRVSLSWKYVPTLQATGEVKLELVASARMDPVDYDDGTTEEPRVFGISVDAF